PVSCMPTAASCRVNTCNALSGACELLIAPAGTSCGDGVFCNGDELCDVAGNCQPGTPPDAGSCAADGGTSDAGITDGGLTDAGQDAGLIDAGNPDAGENDAGAADAGADAGPSQRDSGVADAGTINKQGSCGCTAAGGPGALLGLLLAALRRRRERAAAGH